MNAVPPVPVPVFAGVLCAGVAAWVLAGGDGLPRRARLVLAGGGPVVPGGPVGGRPLVALLRVRASRWREWPRRMAGLVAAALGGSVIPLVLGALSVPLVRRWLRARERERARGARGAGVVALCGAVVGELRAGSQPGQALTVAIRRTAAGPGGPGAAEAAVLAAAAFGGDVAAALHEAAREPGAGGWPGWRPAGGSPWTAARVWRPDWTGWKGRCGPSGTGRSRCGPSWREPGRPRWYSRCCRWWDC